MIRIVIADDHAIVREGLKRIVAAADDMVVVNEAGDGNRVMDLVRTCALDVLVLDLSMPGRSGMALIKQACTEQPGLRILVLSMHEELQYAVRAIKSGARGYLTKESAPAQLVQAIRKVASGGAFISAEVAEQLALGALPGAQGTPHDTLSDREFEVFRRLVDGESVTAIGQALSLSVKTVSTHKANMMHKLGLSNTTELVRYAMRHDLTDNL